MTSGDGTTRFCSCGRPLPADAPRQRRRCDACRKPWEVARSGRNCRGDRPPPRTLHQRFMGKKALFAAAALYPDPPPLPATWGECRGGPRPCPRVSCRYHLFLDVDWRGSIKFNNPDREVEELRPSCALDVAEGRPKTLDAVAKLMNLTREAVRKIEIKAMAKIASASPELAGWLDGGGPDGRRRLPVLQPRDDQEQG
jgi:hypothetical protein